MPPRIVFLTNGSPHGTNLLRVLHARGIRPDAVLMVTQGARKARGPRGLGWLYGLRRLVFRLGRRYRFERHQRSRYAAVADTVVATGAMNSRGMIRDLMALAPDVVVCGGGGILSAEVIATARMAVLNTHPALLPWVRGCAVVEHSLALGVPLGATVHRVDPGIDTGPIISRRLLEPEPDALDFPRLNWAAFQLAWEMMADVLEGILQADALPEAFPQTARYPLHRHTPPTDQPKYDALAAAGRAQQAFREWAPLADPGAGWSLPPGVAEPAIPGLVPVGG